MRGDVCLWIGRFQFGFGKDEEGVKGPREDVGIRKL